MEGASKSTTFLTSAGCHVAINYANSADRANQFAQELESTYPNLKFAVIQADVGTKPACEKLIEETISQLGGLDVIISNAGRLQHKCFSLQDGLNSVHLRTSISQRRRGYVLIFPRPFITQDKCFAVNIKANVWLLRAALPTFHKNPDGGHLLITGSIAVTIVLHRYTD